VDLLSLLSRDVDRARRFLHAELGPLAGDDDSTLRLRATLRAYLDEGRSFVATARRLGIHQNTVKYRVRQCEDALGRPVGERPLRLAAALLLADALRADSPGL
jgi:DNA-binding PucR family transcriptional regulator